MSHGKLYQLAEGLLRAVALVSAYPRTVGPHTTHTHTQGKHTNTKTEKEREGETNSVDDVA